VTATCKIARYDTGKLAIQRSSQLLIEVITMNPFDLGSRLAIASPVFLTERVKTVRDIAKRAAAGAGEFADGIRDLTKHGEISVVDSKDSISHAAVTRSAVCQIAYQDRRGSSRAL
jgi:hypothetical protein